jgi:hypothetical protein
MKPTQPQGLFRQLAQQPMSACFVTRFDHTMTACTLLQVVQPNAANKQAYQEALQRHMQRGQRLFAPQQ